MIGSCPSANSSIQLFHPFYCKENSSSLMLFTLHDLTSSLGENKVVISKHACLTKVIFFKVVIYTTLSYFKRIWAILQLLWIYHDIINIIMSAYLSIFSNTVQGLINNGPNIFEWNSIQKILWFWPTNEYNGQIKETISLEFLFSVLPE